MGKVGEVAGCCVWSTRVWCFGNNGGGCGFGVWHKSCVGLELWIFVWGGMGFAGIRVLHRCTVRHGLVRSKEYEAEQSGSEGGGRG